MGKKPDAKNVKALIVKHQKERDKERTGEFAKEVVIPAATLMNRIKRRGQ